MGFIVMRGKNILRISQVLSIVLVTIIIPISSKAQKVGLDSIIAFVKSNNLSFCENDKSRPFIGTSDRPIDDLIAIRKALLKLHNQSFDDLYIAYFSYSYKPKRFYRIYEKSNDNIYCFDIECFIKKHKYTYKIKKVKQKEDVGLFSLKHIKERQKDKCFIQKGSISTTNGGVGVVYQFKAGNLNAQTFIW